MNRPYVTALIDTYNQSRFIEEAIDSVLAQDFPTNEMEILVVDDGSTDDTRERVAKYGERVRYIHKENGGQASAFNVGFAEARGDIIALLDGDDVWLPQKIRRVVEEFEKHPDAGLVYHPCKIWDTERGTCVDTEFHAVSGYIPDRLTALLTYGDFGTWGMAMRKKIAAEMFPIPLGMKLFADLYLAAVIIFLAPVVALPEHLTKYRHHGANLTSFGAGDRERMKNRLASYQCGVHEIEAWLRRKGFDERRPELASFLRRQALGAKPLEFAVHPPNRRELYAYLREHRAVHGCLWTRRYRAMQSLTSVAAFLLGYRGYELARKLYRRATPLLNFRELLIPHEKELPRAAVAGVIRAADCKPGEDRA